MMKGITILEYPCWVILQKFLQNSDKTECFYSIKRALMTKEAKSA